MRNVLKNLPSWYPEGKEREEIGNKFLKKKEGRKKKRRKERKKENYSFKYQRRYFLFYLNFYYG